MVLVGLKLKYEEREKSNDNLIIWKIKDKNTVGSYIAGRS